MLNNIKKALIVIKVFYFTKFILVLNDFLIKYFNIIELDILLYLFSKISLVILKLFLVHSISYSTPLSIMNLLVSLKPFLK